MSYGPEKTMRKILLLTLMFGSLSSYGASCRLDKMSIKNCGFAHCQPETIPNSVSDTKEGSYYDIAEWESNDFSYTAEFSKNGDSVDLTLIDKRTGSLNWVRMKTDHGGIQMMTKKLNEDFSYFLRCDI
jgi:hypothetical protein